MDTRPVKWPRRSYIFYVKRSKYTIMHDARERLAVSLGDEDVKISVCKDLSAVRSHNAPQTKAYPANMALRKFYHPNMSLGSQRKSRQLHPFNHWFHARPEAYCRQKWVPMKWKSIAEILEYSQFSSLTPHVDAGERYEYKRCWHCLMAAT